MTQSAYRHVVTLDTAGDPTLDDAGGYDEPAVALEPATWHCSITAASARDLERVGGGQVSSTATHVIRGRYHAQLTEHARIHFGDRVFDVESVHDRDERRIELEVIARERLVRAPVAPPAPLTYAELVAADGASHYWRLNELTGAIAADTVGGVDGAIAGGVTLNQPGAIGDGDPAMRFDGTGSVSAPVDRPMFNQSFSVEAWVQADALPSIDDGVYANKIFGDMLGVAGDTTGWYFYMYVDGFIWAGLYGTLAGDPTVYEPQAPTPFAAGAAFHYVVLVVDRTLGTIQLFYNGTGGAVVPIPAVADLTPPDDAPLVIGNTAWLGSVEFAPWLGAIDDVAVYPLALTAEQIAAHFAAAGPRPAPPTYADVVLADNPAHYWRLDESTGAIAADMVGGVDGAIAGGVTLDQPGALVDNASMAFDGTTGVITTPALLWSVAATVEIWAKAAAPIDWSAMLSNRDYAPGTSLLIFCTFGGKPGLYSETSTPPQLVGATSIGDNEWHHLVYVFTAGTATLYVDGHLDSAIALTQIAPGANVWTIAAGSGVSWAGSLDDVAIYARALTAEQVAAHYEASGRTIARRRLRDRDRPATKPAGR